MQVELSPENYYLESTEISRRPVEKSPDVLKLPTKIAESIQRVIEKEGIIKYKLDKRCLVTNGANYLGELYEIGVIGKTVTGDKELNIFVKKILDNEEEVKIISVKDAYKNERYFYKELSKIFENLQDDANIPSDERFKIVKMYDDSNVDLVIMENIAIKGFVTYHRMDTVSLKFLELSFKNIAQFHALSMVLKDRQPEYFKEKIRTLSNLIVFEENIKELSKTISEVVIQYVDDDLKEKVSKLYKNLIENMAEFSNDETIKTCLCHGDYRPNNIMMKEEEGEVKEIISIDYQLIHYGCPIFDLLYLIYLCTDREFRKSHLSNLKNLYYDTLQNFLKYFDLDANTVYPRKEFERVFEEKREYGLLIALQGLPLMFISVDDAADIMQKTDKHFQIDGKFKERLQDVITEFIELGIVQM